MDGLRTDGYARKREQEVRKIMQRTYQECETVRTNPSRNSCLH